MVLDEMIIPTNKVYIEVDEQNRVVKIFSNVFEQPTESSILVGEGNGDKYVHAHLYLDKPIWDMAYNYKYENESIVERTEEEKQADIVAIVPELTPLEKAEARIAQLEEELLATNLYMTDIEITAIANEEKATKLEADLVQTNQYVTDLELLVLENLPIQ